jgi:NodT family efflux transporter outer membrane factor (OMF) lipoprotein
LLALACLGAALLGACTLPPAPPATLSLNPPSAWQAPLPHSGNLLKLSQWWQQQGDPLLVELIDAAQAVSPSLATARSNIEQVRLTRTQSAAALLPALGTNASASRSRSSPVSGGPAVPVNLWQAGLQASWELDLFGENRATRNAAQQRLDGAQAQWHEARVSVAAEVARQYYSLRSCQKQMLVSQSDAQSRNETSRLTALATRAGFEAPAVAALARASAAESRARATQQTALCDIDVKALVALTALDESALRQKLVDGLKQNPAGASAAIDAAEPASALPLVSSVPAEVLAQRPDVYNAARELAAASFEVGSARAQRYPSLSLAGTITTGSIRARGVSSAFDTWSIGPLALTLPLFDGGTNLANIEAAKARYVVAASQYQSTARQAVREVEEALVQLQSTADRRGDAGRAAEGYSASFAGTEARYKAGLASLVELEDARRTLLAAQSAVLSLELERRYAWVALYRALGGGWSVTAPEAPALPKPEPGFGAP